MRLRLKPRGIGRNWLKCFVCGNPDRELCPDSVYLRDGCQADCAAFVPDKETGERVIALFRAYGLFAWLDFRPSEPNWIQVKVGACDKHLYLLDQLVESVVAEDGYILPRHLDAVLAAVKQEEHPNA